MMFLTVEEIIDLHKKLIQPTGGLDRLRDKGLCRLSSSIDPFLQLILTPVVVPV